MAGAFAGFRARRRFWIGVGVAAVSFAAVGWSIDGPGVAWDEPYSIAASERYVAWYLSPGAWFSPREISRHWVVNHEHPPAAKTMMGVVRRAAAAAGIRRVVPASRLSTALLFAALELGVFLFAAHSFGELAGVAAAGCLLLMPRVFGHAHLAVLDAPMACTWLWVSYAFARGIEDRRWSVATGVLFGLALLTKFDAVLIPIPLVAWGLVYHRRRIVPNVVAMAVIGPAVFLLGWPWLWVDTWARLRAYVADKLGRSGGQAWIVPSYYFGRVYADRYAPWHYPLVMTVITVPAAFVVGALGGAVESVAKVKRSAPHGLVLISAAFILGFFSVPFVPKYDGVRLFLSLFPFVAILAGLGLRWIGRLPAAAWGAVVAALVAWQLVSLHRHGPVYLGYYNELVGGARGARRLGMEPTYWGDSVTWSAFRWLDRAHGSTREAAVAFFPKSEFIDAIYIGDGYLDASRFRIVPIEDRWDYAILFARRSMIETNPAARKLWHEGVPSFTGSLDLCRGYTRR